MLTPIQSLHKSNDIVAERYRIAAILGQGSMGITYEAEDLTNYKRVAIKAVSLRQIEDWKILELFEREARVLANLEHPGIPKFLHCFREDTTEDLHFYLVRELAVGDSLTAWVDKGWHPKEDQVKEMALQMLETLDYLHSLTPPVIHRDIKPQNIIRNPNGRVYLVDFGAVQDVYRNTLTCGGTFVGTLGYMPQEQFCGQVNAASDLYSLGATLLFVLTGKSPAELPQRRMKLEFRDRLQVSAKFADWLEKMLEPVVEDRFKSAKEAANALRGQVALHRSHLTESYPTFSGVLLSKNDRHLVCEIPPNWASVFIFSILVTGGFSFFFLPSILSSGIVATVTMVFLCFLVILCPMAIYYGSRRRLEIDRNIFTIAVSFAGWTYQQVRRSTADIALVDVEVTVGSKGKKIINLVIWEGVYKHYFGSILSQSEKEWIASQISKFLGIRRLK